MDKKAYTVVYRQLNREYQSAASVIIGVKHRFDYDLSTPDAYRTLQGLVDLGVAERQGNALESSLFKGRRIPGWRRTGLVLPDHMRDDSVEDPPLLEGLLLAAGEEKAVA